ncbi:hypothetical protein IAT40_007035 [Kwoniella sp. CBS 6097]
MSIVALLSIAALLGARSAEAAWCYDNYRGRYYCNRGGLSWGARLGIGIGIAVGVIVLFSLCGYWRRRQVRSAFSKYKPPALPFSGNNNANGQNPYANNPPPPQGQWNQGQSTYGNSNYSGNPYGNNPAPPAQTYQPSMAGQYSSTNNNNRNENNNGGEGEHEHGYEWAQAREAERLEREQAQAGGNGGAAAPPGYEVATSAQNTGSTNAQYAPPPGAPPPKKSTEGTV